MCFFFSKKVWDRLELWCPGYCSKGPTCKYMSSCLYAKFQDETKTHSFWGNSCGFFGPLSWSTGWKCISWLNDSTAWGGHPFFQFPELPKKQLIETTNKPIWVRKWLDLQHLKLQPGLFGRSTGQLLQVGHCAAAHWRLHPRARHLHGRKAFIWELPRAMFKSPNDVIPRIYWLFIGIPIVHDYHPHIYIYYDYKIL